MTNRRLPLRQSGFSLLETVLALSIAAIALVIALPAYSRYASNQRTRATTHTLASDLMVAKQEAVTRRTVVAVMFSAQDTICPARTASYVVAEPSTVIKRVCFPPDVVWGARFLGPLTFAPNGVTETGATLTVRSARTGLRITLKVTPQTGAVSDATE